MTGPRRAGRLRPVLALVLITACGPVAPPAAPQSVAPAGFGGSEGEAASTDQCVVPKGDTKPFVVEWNAGKRNEVKQLSNDGLLLVVHSGCGLTFLDGCAVGGGYDDVKMGGDRIADSFDIGSATQLKSKLPIGYFELYGKFRKDDRWTLEYVYADSKKAKALEVKRSELPSRCAQATHYVSRIMLGAYRLRSAAARGGEAGATAREAGVTLGSGSDVEVIRQGGDFGKCADQATSGGDGSCQAIVQIYLREITGDVPRTDDARAPSPGVQSPAGGAAGEGAVGPRGAPAEWTPTSSVSADWGWITVTADLPNVPVLIDGAGAGRTPVTEMKVKAGRHSVELRHECLYPARKEVPVRVGETQSVNMEIARREGAVAVLPVDGNGKPLRAEVFLDGKRLGATGGKLTADTFRVSVCDSWKKLEVKAPGYATFEQVVQIREHQTTEVEAELRQAGSFPGTEPPATSDAVGAEFTGPNAERARLAFQKGIELFDSGKYEEAAGSFRRANDYRPAWKIFYNIGQCEAAARHYEAALEAFRKYLAGGGDEVPKERSDEVLQEIARLKAILGQ